jgi:hypothetical protein
VDVQTFTPGPPTFLPKARMNWPVCGLKTLTRLLPSSETNSSPAASSAIPAGSSRAPASLAPMPAAQVTVQTSTPGPPTSLPNDRRK